MLVTLLCILFCKDLQLEGLTLQILFNWYCNHPFLFMMAASEIIQCYTSTTVRK